MVIPGGIFMNLKTQLFAHPTPYPPVRVQQENPRYAAAMLSNMAACSSEMSAVSLYVYNGLLTKDCFPEYSTCFEKISMVEMHHLHLFGELALLLGTDPRLWSMKNDKPVYWSPSCNRYPERIIPLVKNALAGEKETIKTYKEQCSWIKDCYISDILQRIILDEELHVRIFETMLEELTPPVCSRPKG